MASDPLRFGSRSRLASEFGWSLAILAAVALLPLGLTGDYWRGVIVVAMYFAILAAAWNLLAGFTGQFSLAPAAFAAIGAYTTGLGHYHWGWQPALGITAAVLAGGGIGLILGRLVLRLRGPYLGLTTLAFAEIVRLVISNSTEITRGDLGLNVPGILPSRIAYYYFFLAVLVLVQVGLLVLLRTRAGLYLQAIRDDETAAAGRGVSVVRWKTLAFGLSAALSAMAGALYAHFAQLVSPEMALVSQTGLVLSMVVIGGMGTLVGPIAGAFLVYILSEWLRTVGGYQLVVFALLVILVARFFREGLWGLVRQLVLSRSQRPGGGP